MEKGTIYKYKYAQRNNNWWKSSRANGSNWKAPGNNHVSAISTEIFKYVRIHPNFTSRTVWCEKFFLSCFPKTTEKRQAQQSTPTSIEKFNRNATYMIVAWSHSIYISINHKNLKEKRSVLWEYIFVSCLAQSVCICKCVCQCIMSSANTPVN